MFNQLGYQLIKQADSLRYTVKDDAPNTEQDLIVEPTLIVWSGASNNTIWGDRQANWAFRALHDALHLKTRLGFNPDHEIELGRIQASKYDGLLADLIYIEVSEQARYYKSTGQFVQDQVSFTLNRLNDLGYNLNRREV